MSTTARLAKISSRVKGHHEYQHSYKVGEKFNCYPQPDNVFSRHAIVVKSCNKKTIGHIPDGLANILFTLMKDGKVKRIYGEIIGIARSAPEGTWTQGGGIELPCRYYIYGDLKYKDVVREKLRK